MGPLSQRLTLCAVLTLFGEPEVIITVSLAGSEANIMVLEEGAIPRMAQIGYRLAVQETIPAQAEALLTYLNGFIQQDLFLKTDQGLQYVSPKR
jgi:hypothetical protein